MPPVCTGRPRARRGGGGKRRRGRRLPSGVPPVGSFCRLLFGLRLGPVCGLLVGPLVGPLVGLPPTEAFAGARAAPGLPPTLPAQPAPLPDLTGPAKPLGGQEAAESLLRSVLEHRPAVRVVEGALTFRQLITTESLSEERQVVGTANALYEYTPVAGRHLWKLLERDGEPIGGRDLRREERRYRKAVRDAVREAQEDEAALARNDPNYEVKPKNGMDLFYRIVRDAMDLGMFDGDLVEGPPLHGREMQIVRFRPRPGFDAAPSRMLSVVSKCEGELWVDPAERQVARVRARLTGEENFAAGLFGRLYRGTSADVESGFDGRIWLPQRVTMTVDARLYFIRRLRRRVHYDFLGFRTLTASRR